MKNFYRSYPKKLSSLFAFIFVICLIHSVGSGGFFKPEVLEAKGIPEAVTFDNSNPGIQTAMAAQSLHTDFLLGEPGVVGTAVGLTRDDEPAILVFVKSFQSAKSAAIPSDIDGVPVIVHVTGEIKALRGRPVRSDVEFPRPVPIGVSTGHSAVVATAGTIGCRVTDGFSFWALSNNHIYADENNADLFTPVIQPGTADGGSSPADDIGTLSAFVPIDFAGGSNTVDAAIASTTTALLGKSTPSGGYGTPKSTTVLPAVRMNVMKHGRTTNLTRGKIVGINSTVFINYGTVSVPKIAKFENQIVIGSNGPSGFSDLGDSGSLVVQAGGRDRFSPVGLLFAGSVSFTFANPIDTVLNSFIVGALTVDGD